MSHLCMMKKFLIIFFLVLAAILSGMYLSYLASMETLFSRPKGYFDSKSFKSSFLEGGSNYFAMNMFQAIASDNLEDNVIISPASIQSCIALAYFGAEGETAEEIRKGLQLGEGNKTQIAERYADYLSSAFEIKSKGPVLKMANRIYINENLEISAAFNNTAGKYFNSPVKQVRFADKELAMYKINSWVEQYTAGNIKNFLSAASISADTTLIIVNAIYFKGKWLNPFKPNYTFKVDFNVNIAEKMMVNMMTSDATRFKYADLHELDATALLLPYQHSNLKMLIILPNKINGLGKLENHLKTLSFNKILNKMYTEYVKVYLPRFKIEFDVELQESLEKLGFSTMFTDDADFDSLFTNARAVSQGVSQIMHKAVLVVDEKGSEAAAATALEMQFRSLDVPIDFFADHPFVFAILNSKAVFFIGHVVKPKF